MRRLLSLIAIVLLTSLSLGATVHAQDDDPEPTPEASPTQTSDPDPENETDGSDNTTSEPAANNTTQPRGQGRDRAYQEAYRRYLEAWERYNETRAEQEREAQEFHAAYQDSAQACKAGNDSACDDIDDARQDWQEANETNEEARQAYAKARAHYEQMRDERQNSGKTERRPRRCASDERPTADGKCVRDRRPEPSPSARAEREEAYDRWKEQRHRDEDKQRQRLDNVSEEDREKVAMCDTQDVLVVCRHVSFVIDAEHNALTDVTIQETLVFESIVFPGAPEERRGGHGANLVRVEGDDWRYLLSDGAATPMRFRGDAETPFLLTLSADADLTESPSGFRIAVPDGDKVLRAHVGGDVSQDASDPDLLWIHGDARFVVHGRSAAMERLDESSRPAMQEAIERGRVGAEVTVLKANDKARGAPVVAETVLYEDMTIELEEGAVTPTPVAPERVYTVTVDAEAVSGRTITLSFEEGLLDADSLGFRYFDVTDDGAISEVPIIRASGLDDVLDPDDDGTVSEWWLVEDDNGVQVLVSIPSFSVHKIELASLDVVLKDPSLVLGLAGAAAVVTLSLIALFRRPEDD